MLWLIKWAIIFLLVGGAWYSCDFVKNLNPEERQKLKTELIGALDGDPDNNLKGPMMQKAKEDFLSGLKDKIKNLIHKVLD